MNTPEDDTSEDDPEKRIVELEHQLQQQRRINALQHQLDAARTEPALSDADSATTYGSTTIDDLLNSLQRYRSGSTMMPPDRGSATGMPADDQLSAAPRRVPRRFLLAELLPFRWWYLTTMFAVAVPAAIVWATAPRAALPVAILTLALIYGYQLIGTRTRLQLLKWGQVATVTDIQIASRASYYSGVTWYNAPLPFAHGWQVTRPLWSGPSTATDISYTLDDVAGQLRVRGREYFDGVILADSRRPDRAECVTYFPYDLDRDEHGDWVGRLRPRLMLGMAVWLIIVLGWIGGAAAITTGSAARALHHAQAITVGPGASVTIHGSSLTRDATCNQGHLTIDGNEDIVTVTGHCASLTVDGIDNAVIIDAADTITIEGIDNHITYHDGRPTITNHGIRNTTTP